MSVSILRRHLVELDLDLWLSDLVGPVLVLDDIALTILLRGGAFWAELLGVLDVELELLERVTLLLQLLRSA